VTPCYFLVLGFLGPSRRAFIFPQRRQNPLLHPHPPVIRGNPIIFCRLKPHSSLLRLGQIFAPDILQYTKLSLTPHLRSQPHPLSFPLDSECFFNTSLICPTFFLSLILPRQAIFRVCAFSLLSGLAPKSLKVPPFQPGSFLFFCRFFSVYSLLVVPLFFFKLDVPSSLTSHDDYPSPLFAHPLHLDFVSLTQSVPPLLEAFVTVGSFSLFTRPFPPHRPLILAL